MRIGEIMGLRGNISLAAISKKMILLTKRNNYI
jgi:hypothetical protein